VPDCDPASFDGSASEDGLSWIAHSKCDVCLKCALQRRQTLEPAFLRLFVVLHGTFSAMRPVER
jgi:hypothetical protein